MAGIVLGILIIAGAVLSYQKSPETPEQIFSKVSKEIRSHKFMKQNIDFSFTLKDTRTLRRENLSGATYPTEKTYPKMSFFIEQALSSDNWMNVSSDKKTSGNMRVSLENFTEDVVSAKADIVMLEETLFYIKLNELTGVPMDFSSVLGKWWKMDVEALTKNFAGAQADELLESLKTSQLSKEDAEKIKVIVEKYKNAAQFEKLADGEIEGRASHRWSVNLDKKQLARMISEIISVLKEKISDDVEELQISEIEDGFDLIDIKSVEVLVQKRDYLPAQAKFSFDILDEKTGDSVGTFDVSATVSSSLPIEIKAPDNATDILYLIGNLRSNNLPLRGLGF